MTLSRAEIQPGTVQELEDFRALLGRLDAQAWATPTRCEGWTVADVSGHVVGSLADIVAGRFDGLGSAEVTAREVAERKGRAPSELAEELGAATGQFAGLLPAFDDDAWGAEGPAGGVTLGEGVEAIWYDTWAHADDIGAALGWPPATGPGLRAALHHVAEVLEREGWGPATLALDGVDEIPIGNGGPTITGDSYAFVLAATGRGDPAAFGLDDSLNIYR
jgi:uncharacterized protein (TIGR03083 family)